MSVQKISFLNNLISMLPDCIDLEVKRYIACQFALESDFGESPMAKCNNNYCGMKVPVLRISVAANIDEKNKFAVYHGIFSCVMDYLLWLQSNKFSRSELNNCEMFVKHLSYSGYCPESDYIQKINKIYSKYYG